MHNRSQEDGTHAKDSVASRLTPERTMIVVVFGLVFALAASLRIDTDVWWHIRAGADTIDHWVIRKDTFSFTKAGASWIDHSWGAEVIMNLVFRAAGYGGLTLLTGLLALTGGIFVYRMSAGGTYIRALAVVLASVTASIFWSPRPQMFSYALTGAVLFILYLRRHRGIDVLWALPALMLLWANLHGAFAIGFILMAATIVGDALENVAPLDDRRRLDWRSVKKLCLVSLVSLGAVCVNPYGPRILAVPFETAGSSFARLIEEWQPPDLHKAGFWPFAVVLVLLLVSLGASRKRLGWTDGILCSAATLLALSAGRNVATFAVVVTPVLSYHLAAALADRGWTVKPMQRASRPIAALNLMLIVLVLGIAATRVVEPFYGRALSAAERNELPVDAVEYLREHGTRGNLFNAYEWGGYLIYALPEVPVFVDGRSDLYGGNFLYDPYLVTASGGPRWQQQLEHYDIGTVLVRTYSGLSTVLRDSGGWRVAYEDGLATVFEPKNQSP